MSVAKEFLVLGLVLLVACALRACAEPLPEPAKNQLRSAYFDEEGDSKSQSVVIIDDDDIDDGDDDDDDAAEQRQSDDTVIGVDDSNPTASKADESTGRLFLKKFLLFRNLFNQQTPVIPIVVTGAGTNNPTTTLTSTGTIPTATGTIATSPATAAAGTGAAVVNGRVQYDEDDENNEAAQAPATVDLQALQAALAANAQDYVVTDQAIREAADSNSSKKTGTVNIKRKGAKKGQVIQVRIPPRYRNYFKNGQRVSLNLGGNRQGGNRRVIRRKNNKNRNRRRGNGMNKRNRLP